MCDICVVGCREMNKKCTMDAEDEGDLVRLKEGNAVIGSFIGSGTHI